MYSKLKGILIIIPVMLTAFSPVEKESIKIVQYYKLKFLKHSEEPQEVKLIRIENIARSKRLIERGMVFTYKNRSARSVKLAGDFSNWKIISMSRGKYGVWFYFLADCNESKVYRYKFFVDGIWTTDPKNYNRVDDGRGSYISLLRPMSKHRNQHITYRFIDRNNVEFRLYKPDARLISIVGDFNNWNPENDLLTRDSDGYWKIEKHLFRGTYKYKYIIDGRWVTDLYNRKSASDGLGGICSVIKVK